MINLLPPEVKKEILLETKKRVVLSNWILVLLFLGLLLLAMFLIKFYIQKQTVSLMAGDKQFSEISRNEKIINEIDSFNLFFEKLNQFYGQKIYISEILEKISKVLPDKIYLTDFSVSPDLILENKDDELKKLVGFNVSVSGFSPTREELLQLKANVEKDESFNGLSFPLTNWVKSKNIDFSLSFKVVKP